jgi:cell division septum initiation protein DivIVA
VTESPIVAWLTGAAVNQAIAKAAESLAEGKSEDVIAQVGSLVEENALLKSDNAVLRNEIASLAKRLDKVRAELDAIKRAVARGLNKEDFEFSSHRSIIDEIVGKGYGHTESGERLLRMHAQEVVELILKKAGEDVLKQIELAAAVKDRLTDVNPNKDLPVALAIVESVKSWLKEIKNKFKGRFPNDIRSLYQGVHQAVSLADAKYSDVARVLGTSSRLLKEGRARFWAFIEGKVKDLVEFRGKMRSDKFPEEWAEFIVETWCSDRCTRASERSSDEMRNPNTKKGACIASSSAAYWSRRDRRRHERRSRAWRAGAVLHWRGCRTL